MDYWSIVNSVQSGDHYSNTPTLHHSTLKSPKGFRSLTCLIQLDIAEKFVLAAVKVGKLHGEGSPALGCRA